MESWNRHVSGYNPISDRIVSISPTPLYIIQIIDHISYDKVEELEESQ